MHGARTLLQDRARPPDLRRRGLRVDQGQGRDRRSGQTWSTWPKRPKGPAPRARSSCSRTDSVATQTAAGTGRSLIYDELAFGECPRWHDDRLWLSDIFGKRVVAVGLDGEAEEIASVENHPGGLGWLPDGRLLVVSMSDRRLLRLEDDGFALHADLTDVCPGNCNDMVVDARGNAYVGNIGFPYGYRGAPVARSQRDEPRARHAGRRRPSAARHADVPERRRDQRRRVDPGRRAESHGPAYRLRDRRRRLAPRRARLRRPAGRPQQPDGICIDAEGAVGWPIRITAAASACSTADS